MKQIPKHLIQYSKFYKREAGISEATEPESIGPSALKNVIPELELAGQTLPDVKSRGGKAARIMKGNMSSRS